MNILAGRTPKGDEVYIIPTMTGSYRLERRGKGPNLQIEEEQFSSIFLARKAFERWMAANAKDYGREAAREEAHKGMLEREARREEAKKLKNGELTGTTFVKE